MPRREIQFVSWNYYHCFNRSKDKQTIFHEHKDYERFYKEMLMFEEDLKKNWFKIKAFCIMPNYFHLLLSPGTEKDIPLFMQKLQQGYAKYYNIKYSSPGTIWQGRYKVKHIDSDAYMRAVVNYIQKNSEKHLKIPYQDWRYRSDVKINWNYEDMMDELEENELEIW